MVPPNPRAGCLSERAEGIAGERAVPGYKGPYRRSSAAERSERARPLSSRSPRATASRARRSALFFHRRFFDEHHGDLIADGVNERALWVHAFQTRLLIVDLDPRFAFRATKDLQ